MNRLEAMELARDSEHCLRPAEAFSLIGNETRVEILEALWRTDQQPVSFTTLRQRSGVDDSAKFNYHLGQLTGHFVRQTEQGYELRTTGESAVRAAVEGSFNAHPDPDPIETGDDCTRCGSRLVATYSEEKLTIDCPACGRGHGRYSFPPGGLVVVTTVRHSLRSTGASVTSTVSPGTVSVRSVAARCRPNSSMTKTALWTRLSGPSTPVSTVATISVRLSVSPCSTSFQSSPFTVTTVSTSGRRRTGD
jgi:hypothetical protein